jgi:hypothetical protein
MAEEKPKTGPTWIHGNASNQQIDSSGEIVDLAGLDCSSLTQGCFNWEHQNSQPNQVVGKILEYKKIFSEADCENEHHKYFWNKCKVPYLYVMGRLFDDKKESSKEVAALFVDDAEHPDEPPMIGFSIEGSKISRTGITVDKSIARRVTCTGTPCNKACIAELVPNPDIKQQTDSDSIFKSEPAHTIELLSKAETGHEKGIHRSQPELGLGTSKNRYQTMAGTKTGKEAHKKVLSEMKQMPKPNLGKAEVPGSHIKPAHASPTPSKAVKGAPGWSHAGGGNFQHPEHGTVSVIKEGGQFNVKHRGALAGVGGKKGAFGSSQEAGAHAGDYMRSLSQGKTAGAQMHDRPANNMNKAQVPGSKYPPKENNVAGTSQYKAAPPKFGPINPASPVAPKPSLGKSNNVGPRTGGGRMGMGMMGGTGMNLPQESTDKKNARGLFNPDVDKIQTGRGMMVGGMGKNETGHEKGIATKPNSNFKEGVSTAGADVRLGDTGAAKKQSIGRMMEASKIKPKLVASEKDGNLKKGMSAGSGMAAPGNLSGGAALAKESLDKKMKKSQLLMRAEQEYKTWTKREQFENFMAKHMPGLTKGEVTAIGQTLALRKSLRAENKLAKMIVDTGQDSYVNKKEK